MKIQFSQKRVKVLRVTLALVAISLAGYVAYAATQFAVSNTVTVNPANGLGVSITTSNPITCPASGNGAYSIAAFTNANGWTINAGSNSVQYFCLENTGTGTDATPSVTMGTITGVTCTTAPCLSLSTPAIPAIAPGGVSSPIAVTVSATSSASGSGGFSLTVT